MSRFLRCMAMACLGWALTFQPASSLKLIGGAGGAATGYTDFCSESYIAGSCSYAYDVGQRRVSTNTVPFQVTRLSDSSTFNGGYTGSTFAVNSAALISFCLGNGGTTTAETYSTQ